MRPELLHKGGRCERCEDLEWQIRELKKQLAPEVPVPPEWGLTRAEREIYLALQRTDQAVSFEALAAIAVRYSRVEGADDRATLRQHAKRIRRKVRPYGFDVVSEYGFGYRLERKWEASDAVAA